MKRLSTSATILVYVLLVNTPAFAADNGLKPEDKAAVTVIGEAIGSESEETVVTVTDVNNEEITAPVSNAEVTTEENTAAPAVKDADLSITAASDSIPDTNDTLTRNTDNDIEQDNEPVGASGTIEISKEADENTIENEAESDFENASGTAGVNKHKKDKPQEENPWAEKVSGKQLNTLKTKLEALQELYDINWRSYCIAEAINNVERAESPQKRNASLLDDLSRQQLFTAYAVTYVFPELLEIHLQNISERLKKKAEILVDEIAETEAEAAEIISSYAADVDHYRAVNGTYIALVDKSQAILDSIIKTNTDTANLTAFGYYLKNTNDELLKLVSAQMDSFREVTEQSSFTVDYCRQQAEYVADLKESISIKSKYFAEIRSSFKDLEIFLEKYKSQQEFNFHLLSKVVNNRYNELIEKVGKDEIRVGRIRKLVKQTSFKPVNKSIKVLNTQSDLEDVFEKFGFKEIDTKLFETLLAYVGEENWHCRYKEPVSEEEKTNQKTGRKDKTASGEKPRLIDLDEETESSEGAANASDSVEIEEETESSEDAVNASDSAVVGEESEQETMSADSPDQVAEQQQVEGDSGVGADGGGISSDTAEINQNHVE